MSESDKKLGKLRGPLVVIYVAGVEERFCVVGKCLWRLHKHHPPNSEAIVAYFDNTVVGVTQCINSNPGRKIKIFSSFGVPNVRAFPFG